jgi:signal transduction histidine kinase
MTRRLHHWTVTAFRPGDAPGQFRVGTAGNGLLPRPAGSDVPSAGQHAWQRSSNAWHVAFGLLAVSTAALLLFESSPGLPVRMAGLGVLATASGWYAAVGRRVVGAPERSRAGLVFVAVEAALVVALFGLAPSGALMMCMLYPHIWALLSNRLAAFMTAVTGAATAVALLRWTGLSTAALLSVYAVAGGSVLLALITGSWIDRIIEQSKGRAALIGELEAARTEIAELSHANGVMAERARLARDIHDTLAQGFASVLLLLDAMQTKVGWDDGAVLGHLRTARKTAQENLAEARAMVVALTPPQLLSASLPTALRELVDRVTGEFPQRADGGRPLRASLSVTGEAWPLRADAQVVLLRSAQEALTNVRKHAAAGVVDVELSYRPDRVILRVTDDGQGFTPDGNIRASGDAGFGLSGMRARAGEHGGVLRIDSSPAEGTTVTVELPRDHVAGMSGSR